MSLEMKEALLKQKEASLINAKIRPPKFRRRKFTEPKKRTFLLPDDFTGGDLKRAKKLMKSRKTKKV